MRLSLILERTRPPPTSPGSFVYANNKITNESDDMSSRWKSVEAASEIKPIFRTQDDQRYEMATNVDYPSVECDMTS